MHKAMRQLEVEVADDGKTVRLFQPIESSENGGESVEITMEQVPIVIEWLREAAGLERSDSNGSRRELKDIKAQAHLVRRLADVGAGGPQDRGSAMDAIVIALDWAAGDSELSPDEWLASDE